MLDSRYIMHPIAICSLDIPRILPATNTSTNKYTKSTWIASQFQTLCYS